MKTYFVQKDGKTVRSRVPGRYAGWKDGKIFGRLTCASGIRLMRPENRVFFLTWEDAVAAGYRPCQKCDPAPDDLYVRRAGKWQLVKRKTGS